MNAPNPLLESLEHFGRIAGLEKNGRSWYRRTGEVVALCNLQKSQYGRQYYINIAFWLRELGDERYPTESRCHVRARLETVQPGNRVRVAQLLDLDQEIDADRRSDELFSMLTEAVLPIIERGGSVAGLRAMLDDGTLADVAVRGSAQIALARAAT